MPEAKPRESARPTPTTNKKEAEPAAATPRGRRLGKGARRDIRWALRQHPGDAVRDLKVHGVVITYNTGQVEKKKDDAYDDRRVDRDEAAHAPSAEPSLNSAQRRSKARAKKYYAGLKDKAQDDRAPPSLADGARTAGYSPPPAPPRKAPLVRAPAMPRAHPAQAGDASANDDVPMSDASGSGHDPSGKPRKGHGRGGK